MTHRYQAEATHKMAPDVVEESVRQWCAIMTATVGAKQVKVYDYDTGPVYHKVWWADAVTYANYQDAAELAAELGERLQTRCPSSVVAFVRKKDGVVYRADSWKKRGREIGDIRDILVAADQGTLYVTGGKL